MFLLEKYVTDNVYNLHLQSHSLSLSMPVYSYGAIVANNKDLVDSGSFVQVSQPEVSKLFLIHDAMTIE